MRSRSDKDPRGRVQALLEAAEKTETAGLPAFLQTILHHFEDEHPFVRRAALDALGRLAEFRGYPVGHEIASRAARMAEDADQGVRAETAIALAMIARDGRQSEAERLTLHRLLADESPRVRQEAAAALGDVQDASAKEKLAARLDHDSDEDVRFEAAFALAAMKDERALAVLTAALDRPKKRLDACEGLRRLMSRAAVPALERLSSRFFLAWPDRLTVLATMHALGDPLAGARIVERGRARNREERAYALSLIGSHRIDDGRAMLIEVAMSPSDPLRDTAVRALGELGHADAVPVLERIASEDSAPSELKGDACAAIERIRRGGAR